MEYHSFELIQFPLGNENKCTSYFWISETNESNWKVLYCLAERICTALHCITTRIAYKCILFWLNRISDQQMILYQCAKQTLLPCSSRHSIIHCIFFLTSYKKFFSRKLSFQTFHSSFVCGNKAVNSYYMPPASIDHQFSIEETGLLSLTRCWKLKFGSRGQQLQWFWP